MSTPAPSPETLELIFERASRRFGLPRASLAPELDLFETLGVDSVEALDLLTELEEHFDVELPDYELREISSFASLAQLVERRR